MNLKLFKSKQYDKYDIDKILLCTLVFLLPFERIPSMDLAGITLRLSFMVAFCLIIRAGYLVLAGKHKIQFTLWSWLLAAFVAWMVMLVPFSLNHHRAVEVVIFTMFTIATAFGVFCIYQPRHLMPIIKAILISASVVVAFGVYQYIANLAGLPEWLTGLRDRYSWQQFGFPRIQSTALEPLYLISYLLIPLSFGITFLLVGRPKIKSTKKKLIILLLAMVVTVFLSVSRGGILAFGVLAIYLSICIGYLRLTSFKKVGALVSIIVGGFLCAIVMINFLNKPPQNLLLTHGKKGTHAYTQQLQTTGLEGSGDERAQTRNQAIDILKSSNRVLIVGMGPGQFGPKVQNNQKGGGWFIVNNLTLELLVEEGLIGSLLFATFMISLFVSAFKSLRSSKEANQKLAIIALSGYLVATAVQYQTFSTLYIMHIWVAIGLFMALTKAYGTDKRSKA